VVNSERLEDKPPELSSSALVARRHRVPVSNKKPGCAWGRLGFCVW